jgi:LysM repeat protein
MLIHCVVPGDTLTSIAEELDVPLLGLEQVNEQIQDFDLIFPGEVIQVPVGLQGQLSCGDAFFLPTEVSTANWNQSVRL